MSLATSEPRTVKFVTRFEHVWASLRRYQAWHGLSWSVLLAVLGLAILAAADYRLELPWRARATGLFVVAALIVWAVAALIVSPWRWWTKRRTAAEIESRFPQLGQRIRTVVQYAGLRAEQIDSEGVAPSLVTALEEETEVRAQPIPLDGVVPWRRVWAVAAPAALVALAVVVAATANSEWRIALKRALLSTRPYTTISVAPGDLRVDQGQNVPVAVVLSGRVKRDVVLYTRPAGDPAAEWKASVIAAPERGPASRRETELEKIEQPLDYRVTAGDGRSPTYRIDVRYPLAIKSFDVALVPPAYTNIRPSTVQGGDLRVIEGTDATFRIAFDATPAEASLVLTDPSIRSGKDKARAAPQVIALKPGGPVYTAGLHLTKGLIFEIAARSPDGRILPKNRYRIDVLEDRAPRVSFEQPDEALEVHPIAEVFNRIRVADDFGLTRAGIVFQFNNGDAQTLVMKDFTSEPAKARTSSALQETLLLEKLAATPTDSVTYYAFAEDNNPAGARRTETDLRYVDIRPFKRKYELAESSDAAGEPSELVSLGELIARQRFNFNRANRLAKHKPTDRTFTEDPLKIAGFEETLVAMTRELTAGVENIVGQRIEPLHAAEESMLAAVSALDHGQNARAPVDMGDALRHLIEARDTIRVIIGQDPKAMQALRSFDRTQAQKIRKPKKDQEEAEEIAEEIEALAQDEDFVYATLAGLQMEQEPTKGEQSPSQTQKDEADTETKDEPAEKEKDEAKKDTPKSKGRQKGQKGSGGQGKGQSGESGQPEDGDDEPNAADQKNDKRRQAVERQEQIADRARELEEKLKKLEDASDLAKVRMTKAAETTEKASGALARGNTKEATEAAKDGAAKLHELARQVKGEIARDVAQELAMARDLADELAEREGEMGKTPGSDPQSGADQGSRGNQPGQEAKSDQPGKNAPGKSGDGDGGRGERRRGGRDELTDAERLERLEEAARTLEQWLKDASLRAEGEPADRIRELIEERSAGRIVERMQQIGALYLGGREAPARREAIELSKTLELLARELEVLHRVIVAPELAAIVELDRRVAELTEKLKTIKTDAEIAEWHRLADALVRDLEKAGISDGAANLTGALDAGGWDWGMGSDRFRVVPARFSVALQSVSILLQSKIQNMILKDMASDRDEATPPEFKELIERYYEVLSRETGRK